MEIASQMTRSGPAKMGESKAATVPKEEQEISLKVYAGDNARRPILIPRRILPYEKRAGRRRKAGERHGISTG